VIKLKLLINNLVIAKTMAESRQQLFAKAVIPQFLQNKTSKILNFQGFIFIYSLSFSDSGFYAK